MRPHEAFFYGSSVFLFGVTLASFDLTWKFAIALSLVGMSICAFCYAYNSNKRFFWWSLMFICLVAGNLYFSFRVETPKSTNVNEDQKSEFVGVVTSDPKNRETYQEFDLRLEAPQNETVSLKTARYPELKYGDRVRGEGVIKKSLFGNQAKSTVREIAFPKIEKVSTGNGSKIKSTLFNIKNAFVEAINRVLPKKEAALLAGITVGEREGFSKEFRDAMSKSGTTHIVALSGYNVSVIVLVVMTSCLRVVRRRTALIITACFIVMFVIMTGAESSVVRAAIMGSLVLLARELGAMHSMRNVLCATALLMVLVNPKVLIFDIGFQLSFLALLGIVYLKPVIQKYLNWRDDDSSFLNWRENTMTTLAAQIMVTPLILGYFGTMSPISILPNILILETVPFTMFFGFLIGAASIISEILALILAFPVSIVLKFQIITIEIFSRWSPLAHSLGEGLNKALWTLYYAGIFGIIYYHLSKTRKLRKASVTT